MESSRNEIQEASPSNPKNLRYRLIVTVVSGRSLQAKDWNGLSDPYVTVRFGRRKRKTFVCPKTLSPSWNTSFSLQLCDVTNSNVPKRLINMASKVTDKAKLIFHVWDKDFLSRDFMGLLEIPWKQMYKSFQMGSGKEQKAWYDLQGLPGKSSSKEKDKEESWGQLQVCYSIVPVEGRKRDNQGSGKKGSKSFFPFFRRKQVKENDANQSDSQEDPPAREDVMVDQLLEENNINDSDDSDDSVDEDDWYLVDSPEPAGSTAGTRTIPTSHSNDSLNNLSLLNLSGDGANSDGKENDCLGLMNIEILEAKNLPRERNKFGILFDSDPFVVISFGKQTFRTRYVRHSLNPVWREHLYFLVKPGETSFSVSFSIYDHDNFSSHDHLGRADVKIAPYLDGQVRDETIGLDLNKQDGFNNAVLKIKIWFKPFEELKRDFWAVLAKAYDHDSDGKLNRIELETMLESIGSTLSDETFEQVFSSIGGGNDPDAEISVDELINSVLNNLNVTSNKRAAQRSEENLLVITHCPICGKGLSKKRQDLEIIAHLSVCASIDPSQIDGFVMGGFVTEEYASRRWFTKLFSFLTLGGYNIGKNNGNILVQDRETGKMTEEKMPTYIRLGMRAMHQNYWSKMAIKIKMMRQLMSSLTAKQGRKFDDPASVRHIKPFIRYHNLPVQEILEPLDSFRTFNQFFYRKLKPGSRPIAMPQDPEIVVSAADCRFTCYESVDSAKQLWIKGQSFNIPNLLAVDDGTPNTQLVPPTYYDTCSLCIFRLAPQDYHRFHCPVDGKIASIYHIPGTYYTVNPMAIRQNFNVYTDNTRTIVLIDSKCHGIVAYVCIGAMMVGSIIMTVNVGDKVCKGDELGYFAFGGSTIVSLFPQPLSLLPVEKNTSNVSETLASPNDDTLKTATAYPENTLKFDRDLLGNSQQQLETLIKMGTCIASRK